MILSKLTSHAQTTIPQPVRVAPELQPSEEFRYEIIADTKRHAKPEKRIPI